MSGARVQLGRPARTMLRLANRGGRFRFLGLWQRWEPIAMWLWRVRPVRPGSLLLFGKSPYRGQAAALRDGTLVRKGDRILHLHFDNRRLTQASPRGEPGPWALVEQAGQDLDALAEDVVSGRLGDVRAIRGVTVLAAVTSRAGFEVRPLPHNLRWALIRYLSALVMASYHRDAIHELNRGVPWPGEVWMSAGTLGLRLRAASPQAARTRDPEVEPTL